MSRMRRDDIIWTIVITLIAVTINPILKSIGLLPADVFRGLGVFYPGLPQIVFGPLMAFLLLLLFMKTGQPMVFPVIGLLRALSLSFVFRPIWSIAAPCWRRSSRAELRPCS
jgi:hypothetical protein